MSLPLPPAVERAVEQLLAALGLACVQITINLSDDGRVQSVEPRLKLARARAREASPEPPCRVVRDPAPARPRPPAPADPIVSQSPASNV